MSCKSRYTPSRTPVRAEHRQENVQGRTQLHELASKLLEGGYIGFRAWRLDSLKGLFRGLYIGEHGKAY